MAGFREKEKTTRDKRRSEEKAWPIMKSSACVNLRFDLLKNANRFPFLIPRLYAFFSFLDRKLSTEEAYELLRRAYQCSLVTITRRKTTIDAGSSTCGKKEKPQNPLNFRLRSTDFGFDLKCSIRSTCNKDPSQLAYHLLKVRALTVHGYWRGF